MTKEEALKVLDTIPTIGEQVDALEMAIKALEQQPCEDCISRQAAIDMRKRIEYKDMWHMTQEEEVVSVSNIKDLPSVTPQQKIGYCRDCKWWKDSDGSFRRGIGAESQCPLNRIEVYEGNGYCFLFEPKK